MTRTRTTLLTTTLLSLLAAAQAQKPSGDALLTAAQSGLSADAMALLKQGAPVNAIDATGETALAKHCRGAESICMYEQSRRRRFTTAFLAELDPATHELVYINAGHNAPMIRRASGAIERLEAGGLPLGILREAKYESGRVSLQPGDWLLIFTDGLVEAVNNAARNLEKNA